MAVCLHAAEVEAPIDMGRVRQLMQRVQAGETLSAADLAYLDKARQQMRGRSSLRKAGNPQLNAGPGMIPADKVDTSGLVALTDMTGSYKGEDGGLYGHGLNSPPEKHYAAYLKASEKIQPLDAGGKPSPDGKIGLITIGFSNTSLESADFKRTADVDPAKSPRVIVVNGAIGSRAAVMWAYDGAAVLPVAEQARLDKEMDTLRMPKTNRKGSQGKSDQDTWPTLDQRLQEAGLVAGQVQAVWMKHVEAGPRALGDFPAHAKALQMDMAAIMVIAKKRFPNLRVAFISSRTYGGWAGPNSGSPEPFAYECAFAVRGLIQSQIQGDPQLNYDPARGNVQSPILLWGPYLWANGDNSRKLDGFTWSVNDVRSDDHMHPGESGCQKVTEVLLNFFKTDPGTRRWFVRPEIGNVGKPTAPGGVPLRSVEEANRTPATPIVGSSNKPGDLQPAPLAASNPKPGTQNPQPSAPSASVASNGNEPIDPRRGKQLMEKFSAGEKLTPEETAYLDRVRLEIRRRQELPKKDNPGSQKDGTTAGKRREPVPRDPTVNNPKIVAALVPLTELTATYKSEDGGLYGGGHNEPPPAHLEAARKQTAQIRPLDGQGHPAADGKIVLMSVGLSHTTMEFSEFKKVADADPEKSPLVVVVDGAQGGKPAVTWALSGSAYLSAEEVRRLNQEVETGKGYIPQANRINEWEVADARLKTSGVTPLQVQVLWLKEAVPMPALYGEFPAHARAMAADITSMLIVAQKRYPNLRLVYLSSRSFGGYAHDGKNPEPFAYENAFSVRWVIQAQINGDTRLNYDPSRGVVTAPLLLWGPYLWANAETPRKMDGLIWKLTDYGENDGMHPSAAGKQKVAGILLKFFKTDPLTRGWFGH